MEDSHERSACLHTLRLCHLTRGALLRPLRTRTNSPPARLATSTGQWFDNLSPRYLSLDGLLARFPNRMYNPRLTGQSIVQPGRQTYDVLRRVSGFDGGL